jgi:DNA-binding beta-propeller fold protein YncE
MEFDQAGNLLRHWGGTDGPGYQWPASNHGVWIDHKGNVWIGGNGADDGHVLKFTQDGKFIKQFGFAYASAGSTDTWAFRQVAKIFVDKQANEAYIADGYGNHRVVVIDADTGQFKRFWGAYGNKPNDENLGRYNPDAPPAQQFRNPVHCAEMSVDRLVYVCDRTNDRIQVFTPEGKFVKEQFIAKRSLADGSVWDIAFSKDPQQKYLYLADGRNQKVYIIERQPLQLLTSFGDGGRQPGEFFGAHSIAVDSKGNIYITETYEGKRVQKFKFKGIAAVPAANQGVLWPTRATGGTKR